MRDSEHTPGPWEVEVFDQGTPKESRTIVHHGKCAETGELVIDEVCDMVLDYSDETLEANTRLIAAAPDLLEACEDALSACVDPYGPVDRVEAADKLRDAIKKAKGKI